MTGTDEGGFAWLTLNYLLGHLGKSEAETIAAIDLGGGSVQQAFALTAAEAKEAPSGYVTELSGGGKDYSVYVHRCSHLSSIDLIQWDTTFQNVSTSWPSITWSTVVIVILNIHVSEYVWQQRPFSTVGIR